jgi:hypothetical protein
MSDRDHPIIQNPWEYKVILFQYDCSSDDYLEHFIDLWLKKEHVIKKLRFIGPRQLIIEDGFPCPTHGMQILDVSDRGLENVNVWVSDFEASNGSITFYAKEFIEIK